MKQAEKLMKLAVLLLLAISVSCKKETPTPTPKVDDVTTGYKVLRRKKRISINLMQPSCK